VAGAAARAIGAKIAGNNRAGRTDGSFRRDGSVGKLRIGRA